MLKIGIFGAGHLGKIHIQLWTTIPGVEIIGFYDPSDEQSQAAERQFQIKRYTDPNQLILDAQVIDIVTPTLNHFDIAKACLMNGKHVFIEKPITHTLQEARALIKLVEEANVKCQIGHVERYNPAFVSVQSYALNPMFIEAHRLSEFQPRGTDVSVVLDLMIHDIDIVLHIVKSKVKRIAASGVAVVSPTPDIANARIEFDNGCVANLTSSRIALKKMRKMRIFQPVESICIDFLNKKSEIISLIDTSEPKTGLSRPIQTPIVGFDKSVNIQYPIIENTNAIQMELTDFVYAIVNDTKVKVNVYDGVNALEVAYKIIEKIGSPLQHKTKISKSK